MTDPFRHIHMPPELACEFLAVFSRMEYALKATPGYVRDAGNGRVEAAWDSFANEIDGAFVAIHDDALREAVTYLLGHPPRKQVVRDGVVRFDNQEIDLKQRKTQQVLLMIRTVRNNLFHGGKHYPEGEQEQGRNRVLVSHALIVLKQCAVLHPEVRSRYEY